MPVEDHPLYSKWRAALEELIAADDARKAGVASDADVTYAAEEFRKIAEEIDA